MIKISYESPRLKICNIKIQRANIYEDQKKMLWAAEVSKLQVYLWLTEHSYVHR